MPTQPHALVADDHPSVRALLTTVLTGAGYRVTGVADGAAAAAELLGPGGPGFTAAVLDCDMPGLRGPEVLARIRAVGSRVPVLLVSGLPDSCTAAGLPTDPLAVFLAKPFRPHELLAALATLVSPDPAE